MKLIADGVTLINLQNDETSGDAVNAGTLGHNMTYSNGGPRETP